MPLYMCNAKPSAIEGAVKSKIAADITRIHCAVTDAPPTFVHAFFVDGADHLPLNDKSAIVLGTIRGGRNDGQKQQIADDITQSVHQHTGLAVDQIGVLIIETPASWVMEGGDLLPEPGEEAEWLKAHDAKLAAAGQ